MRRTASARRIQSGPTRRAHVHARVASFQLGDARAGARARPLGRRHHLRGQRGGQRLAPDLQPHEVHGERKLVRIKLPVLVHIGQLPDSPQRVDGQVGSLEHGSHGRAAHLAPARRERREDLIVLDPLARRDGPDQVVAKRVRRARNRWRTPRVGGGGGGRKRRRRAHRQLRDCGRRWRNGHHRRCGRARRCDGLHGRVRVRVVVAGRLRALQSEHARRWRQRGVHLLRHARFEMALVRELLHQLGDVAREHEVHRLDELFVKLWELAQVVRGHGRLEARNVREVADGQLEQAMYLEEDVLHVGNEERLLLVLAKERRHLLLQMADQVGVHAREACALDQLVHLAHRRVTRDVAQVLHEVLHLHLEEALVVRVPERLVPERADVHAADLWRLEDFAQGPHQRAVDAHQLLRVHLVGLVQHDAHLVVVPAQRLDDRLELVRDVELVRVEEEKDHVCPRGEPFRDADHRVAAIDALLLARQDAGRVDDRQVLEQRARHLRALELGEEAVPENLQAAEGHVRRDGERVARSHLLLGAVHHRDEPVGGGLGTNVLAGEVAAEEVADE
mmetsp:Transcript_15178/g.47359  ORF Transcript_15178/g.47359 Transcript_15178/m.47359 type:complete len:563 (+) Transcript_15178:622-2310(+)